MADLMRTKIAALVANVVAPYPGVAPLAQLFTNVAQVYTSSVTGTGVALPVTVPGTPRVMAAFNRSAACFVFKTAAMPTLYGMLLTGAPALSYSDQIASFAADTLTFGTTSDINTATEVIEYVVWI